MNLRLLRPILRPNAGHVALLAALGLGVIGLEAIATAPTPEWMGNLAAKQAVYMAMGVVACFIVALPHYRLIGQMTYPLALLTAGMLIFLLIPGIPQSVVPVVNGASRWIDLQVALFQPSEAAKVAFILVLARYLRYRENYRTLRGLTFPLAIAFVPMGLIVVEPDLGTAMIFLPVLFAMLIAAGAKIKHLLMIITLGLALMPAMYPVLQPHQKERIVAIVAQFADSERYEQSIGFQGAKAVATTGSGQVIGYGAERAETIIDYNGLPESHNDMIFAVICARWGLFGGVAVLGLYMLLIGASLEVAGNNKDPFARLTVVGVVTVIFTQVFVNVGMTIGLLPITGMTLPLISYGGSSLLVNFMMIGLILNAAAHRPVMSRPSFEFDRPKEVGGRIFDY